MIVVKPKPIDEVTGFIKSHRNILIVGCDGCTTPPRGLREAQIYANLLEMAGKLQGLIFSLKTTTVPKTCDKQIAYSTLAHLLEDADAILTMACGIGVQVLNEVFPQIPTYPANNTVFNGMQEKEGGIFEERCKACGECILGETGGICPVTRCAKGLLNGPCGGCVDGKCEVKFNGEEHDCAWYLIYRRLKDTERLENFRRLRAAKNWGLSVGPRRQVGAY